MNAKSLLSLALLAPSLLPAALVSENSIFGADTVTLDTAANLRWLDLTVTRNISYNSMQGQLATTFAGWRYATDAERTTFFTNAGIPNVPGQSTANLVPVQNLMALLGGPLGSASAPGFFREWIDGFDGQLGGLGATMSGNLKVGDDPTNLQGSAFPGLWGSSLVDFASNSTGHWLVQDASSVPEPSTMALAALGLAAAAWRRRSC